MSALLRILALWRGHALGLGLGLVIALASLACGVALMTFSGLTIAAVLTGTALATPLILRVTGIGRVVLRYFERLVGHDATFRALADLRGRHRRARPAAVRGPDDGFRRRGS